MGLAVFRDISLIWLIFLTLVAVLPFAFLFFFAVKGMIRLRQLTKLYAPIAQEKAQLLADTTEEISHKIANPVIQAQAKAAQANGLAKAIFTRRSST